MRNSITIVLVAATLLLLIGCSKVNQENYHKLKVGMKYAEVVALLGKADNCNEALGSKSCIWGDENKNITVNFIGDTCIIFSNTGLQ
ncbi:MAG: DUF3862 domain-containing protein [Desulfobulbaceae bacterium]|nr:DUF3862 domain-containing protein [Desulfobulbaceae bacterium]HIJ78282.1 DUF3862 domain-containing protein [Deltaproteobacteria bacterium]